MLWQNCYTKRCDYLGPCHLISMRHSFKCTRCSGIVIYAWNTYMEYIGSSLPVCNDWSNLFNWTCHVPYQNESIFHLTISSKILQTDMWLQILTSFHGLSSLPLLLSSLYLSTALSFCSSSFSSSSFTFSSPLCSLTLLSSLSYHYYLCHYNCDCYQHHFDILMIEIYNIIWINDIITRLPNSYKLLVAVLLKLYTC